MPTPALGVCVMCGREVECFVGQNTLYWPADGRTYAWHQRGDCGRPDTAAKWRILDAMASAARVRHRVPESALFTD